MAHTIDDAKADKRQENNKREDRDGDVTPVAKKRPETCTENGQPTPPDGGWGWFVVFASFMVHVVADGVTYSFGVFHTEFLHYFNESKAATALIASLLVGVTLCSGPVSSAFVDKYGCRPVTIAGSILSCVCLLASSWAQNVLTLDFTVGIGTGLGFGLIYLPAIVCVTCYFEKYRSLATGIAVCGSGIGTLVFAPLIEKLIGLYGWRGAMIVTAGLVLNCILFGAVFRPIKPSKVTTEQVPLKVEVTNEPLQAANALEEKLNRPASVGINGTNGTNGTSDMGGRHHSVHNVNSAGNKYHDGILQNGDDSSSNNIRSALSQPILASLEDESESHAERPFNRSCGSGIMNRSDVFLRSSFRSISKRTDSLENTEENLRFRSSIRSLPNGAGHKALEPVEESSEESRMTILKKMLAFSLLKDPIFLLFTISNFCTSIGFNIPYIYIMPLAESVGVPKDDASYLLSCIGIANTIGRIVLGIVSDVPGVNRLFIYNICLTVCGFATLGSIFCYTFTALAFYSVVFGFTTGAYVGLTSVILVDLMGLELLTSSFGLLLLFQGIASLLGPPIGGWLYDAFTSYIYAFILAGSMIAVSGMMLFAIPSMQRSLQRKNNERLQRLNAAP